MVGAGVGGGVKSFSRKTQPLVRLDQVELWLGFGQFPDCVGDLLFRNVPIRGAFQKENVPNCGKSP